MDPSSTNSSFLPSNPWAPVASDYLPQTSQPAPKAKLLCSFGGRILPRPGDSALRYIGGNTRLISIQKDLGFPEFMRKLSSVVTSNEQEADPSSPRLITCVKYQLPGEDLDALVSVSCQEDLENMIEEYDKLSVSSSDGSAKLRVFLFPQSEPDLNSMASDESGQKYINAINSAGPSTEGIKESVASAGSSTHNSDNAPLQDCLDNLNDIMSPPVQSPTAAYVANPPILPDRSPVPVHPPPVPVAGYMTPQGFVESQQFTYLNPHQMAGNMPINMVPVPVNAYPPSVPVTTTAIPVSPLKPVQVVPPVQPIVQPIVQPVQTVQPAQTGIPTDSNNYKVLQPLSQLPPLPPVYLQPSNSDKYATRMATQISPQGIRYDDCAMCQKSLPHAHSDNMVPELGSNSSNMDQTQNPVFYSLHPDNTIKQTSPTVSTNQLATNTVIGNPVITNPGNIIPVSVNQLADQGNRIPVSNGVFIPVQQDPFQASQVQTQPYWTTMNPNMYHMIMNNNNVNYQNQMAQNYGNEFTQNYVTGIDSRMQAVNLGLTAPQMDQIRPQVSNSVLINQVQNPVQQLPAVSVQPVVNNPQEPSIISNNNNNIQYSNSSHGSPVYTMDMNNPFIPPQPVSNVMQPQAVNIPNNNVIQPQIANNPNNNVIQPPKGTANDSLFSNHDPWNQIGGNGNLMPPIPTRIAPTKDQILENNLDLVNRSTIVSLLEEGNLPRPDPQPASKGSGEDSVKRQLQTVAENAAASVLESSLSGGNKSSEKEGPPRKTNIEKVLNAKEEVQEMKNHQLDKVNPGVPLVDDIGHLQIIKNSDLEELRELGSGTFGTVYHGKWRGTDVAIKRINDRCFAGKPSEQEKMRNDFWNEACKLASLHHPNVVAFYGLVLDGPDGAVATVTEYMANGSLRQALQRNDKILDRRRRLVIAMDVAFGMEYLHGKNIVHFDLKSDNLLVNLRDPQRPICKVGDLGLSKVKCQTLISGGVRGTLPWMAPELLNGSSSLVSEKVDVFSFGIVMWELLTGDEPYADLHYGAIIGGIVNNTLRPPIPESCDPEWRSLMEQCWSNDTSERPSFTEVVNRLRSMATAFSQKAQVQK